MVNAVALPSAPQSDRAKQADEIRKIFLRRGREVSPELVEIWLDDFRPFRHDRVMRHLRRVGQSTEQFPMSGHVLDGMREEVQGAGSAYIKQRAREICAKLEAK